jgi:hypothetical protein
MTTLANIQTAAILGDDVTVEGLATALTGSTDAYAVENFIAKLIFSVNKYENTLVDPTTVAKTNATWGVNGNGIVSFSIRGLCNFDGGVPSIGTPDK